MDITLNTVSNEPILMNQILDEPISTYLLNKNILAHPLSINFYVQYLLDKSILAHALSIKVYIPTQQKYSSAPSFYQILCMTYLLLNKNILAHPLSIKFYEQYLLDKNILAHPHSIKVCVPTWQKYSSAPSLYQSLRMTNLLNKNILAHPLSIKFYVQYLLDKNILAYPPSIKVYVLTRQKYSSTPSFYQILCTYLTKITLGNFWMAIALLKQQYAILSEWPRNNYWMPMALVKQRYATLCIWPRKTFWMAIALVKQEYATISK